MACSVCAPVCDRELRKRVHSRHAAAAAALHYTLPLCPKEKKRSNRPLQFAPLRTFSFCVAQIAFSLSLANVVESRIRKSTHVAPLHSFHTLPWSCARHIYAIISGKFNGRRQLSSQRSEGRSNENESNQRQRTCHMHSVRRYARPPPISMIANNTHICFALLHSTFSVGWECCSCERPQSASQQEHAAYCRSWTVNPKRNGMLPLNSTHNP